MICKNRIILLFIWIIGCLLLYWSTLPWFSDRNAHSGMDIVHRHPTHNFLYANFFYFNNYSTGKFTSQNDSSTKRNSVVNFDENLVVIYNRIPKTGSTSFINLAYDLCKKNKFHVLHINITANMHVLSLQNQLDFVKNITHWNEMKPALYHGHMAYLDFSKYNKLKNEL